MLIACLSLGACYIEMSKLNEAEEAFSEAVRINSAVLPPGHRDITAGKVCADVK